MSADQPAGIYVHVPFCLTRCGYCDFNAYAGLDELKPRYLSALLREATLDVAGAGRGRRSRACSSAAGRRRRCARPIWRGLLMHLRVRVRPRR